MISLACGAFFFSFFTKKMSGVRRIFLFHKQPFSQSFCGAFDFKFLILTTNLNSLVV